MEIPMKKLLLVLPAVLLLIALGHSQHALAQNYPPGYEVPDQADLLTPEELDDLLAPIALYPDPLIAQILPAATFADQIDEAARYVRQFGSAGIDYQPWDLSVRAVAHYPDVLFMMDRKYEWTVSLGQAFLEQQQDVLDAIQRLRADALEQGNLVSTREQQVIDDQYGIRIVPAVPEYVYVPVYDPEVVYVERYNPYYPFITFSGGLIIGAWLNRDFDWRRHRVYYHGWRGGGWISRSRPHIHDRDHVYINKRAAEITLNNRVLQHDTRRFRQELRTETVRRREQGVTPARPSVNQPAPGRGIERRRGPEPARQRAPEPGRQRAPEPARQVPPAAATQPPQVVVQPPATAPRTHHEIIPPGSTATAPAIPARQGHRPVAGRPPVPATAQQAAPVASSPTVSPQAAPSAAQQQKAAPAAQSNNRELFRGRDLQRTQPASRSGYGGYGSGRDAAVYHERGAASLESIKQPTRPAPAPRPSPAPAPSVAPAPRPVAPTPPPAAAPAPRPAAPAPAPTPVARPSGGTEAPRTATPRPAEREKR
jgi:hypothetical protein